MHLPPTPLLDPNNGQNTDPLYVYKYKLGGLPDGEIQYGRTMIFIRDTDTYYKMEQLREKEYNIYTKKIQHIWLNYSHRREYINIQVYMTDLYKNNHKQRRRESIFRPYQGDYLSTLTADVHWNNVYTGIMRILHYYNTTTLNGSSGNSESIVFVDLYTYQIVSCAEAPFWRYERRVVVLTDAALYLMELTTDAMRKAYAGKTLPE